MKHFLFAVTFFATLLHAQADPNAVRPDSSPHAKSKDNSIKATPATKAASIRWEYKTVAAFDNANEDERLNALGERGWELVSVVYVTQLASKVVTNEAVTTGVLSHHLRYYFKRALR
jgi:hypothetical protein